MAIPRPELSHLETGVKLTPFVAAALACLGLAYHFTHLPQNISAENLVYFSDNNSISIVQDTDASLIAQDLNKLGIIANAEECEADLLSLSPFKPPRAFTNPCELKPRPRLHAVEKVQSLQPREAVVPDANNFLGWAAAGAALLASLATLLYAKKRGGGHSLQPVKTAQNIVPYASMYSTPLSELAKTRYLNQVVWTVSHEAAQAGETDIPVIGYEQMRRRDIPFNRIECFTPIKQKGPPSIP